MNETIGLLTEVYEDESIIPASAPSVGQARKAAVAATLQWLAPAGASLNTYTGGEVIASFTTSGPKVFTVIASYTGTVGESCTATDEIEINVKPSPDVVIYFPNSLTSVPVSAGVPTVTQLTQENTIRAGTGVFYEWCIVIDRVNGYEIRHVESNDTGLFKITLVGPYKLTVTGANGCKRTVRGVVVQTSGAGG